MKTLAQINQKLQPFLSADLNTAGPAGLQLIALAAIVEQLSKTNTIIKVDAFADVVAFHKKFQINYDGPPRVLPASMQAMRDAFLKSELQEYTEADNESERFDALLDMIYVILGTIHLQGWDFYEGWKRVQAANMAKKFNPEVKANPKTISQTMGIVKPAGWVHPQFYDLVCNNQLNFPTLEEMTTAIAAAPAIKPDCAHVFTTDCDFCMYCGSLKEEND